MEGGVVFESLLQNQKFGFDSSWVSNSFHGEETNAKKSVSNEEYDKCFRQPEKKRRLTVDQVHFLEKRFEEDNKLEQERKVELAKELNLQPRQVAIWFQNRRARCKTKQLEKEYEVLSSSYEKLKLEFDCLQQHNHKLKQEVQMLKEKLNIKGTREKDLISNESPTNSSDQEPNPISIQTWTNSSDQEPNPISIQTWTREPKMVICKQEYANSVSAKSDIIDSYSPDGNHSSFLEPYDSSNVFENQSDLSQEEEDNLTVLRCPKVDYESYIDTNDGSLVYPVEDQQPFWLWP